MFIFISIMDDFYISNVVLDLIVINFGVINDCIGNEVYDIGYVLSINNSVSGLVWFQGVCVNDIKVRVVFIIVNLIGDLFVIVIICYEMGYQFGVIYM